MDAKTNHVYDRLKTRLRGRLMQLLDADASSSAPDRKPSRKALEAELRQALHLLTEDAPEGQLPASEQERLIMEVLSDVVGLGPLDEFFADQTISEIMVNGPDDIFV